MSIKKRLIWQEDDIKIVKKSKEKSQHEVRAAKSRAGVAAAFRHIFADNVRRVIRKERADIKSTGLKYLTQRDINSFNLWVEEYYKKLPDYMQTRLAPGYLALAEAVRKEIGDELNIDGKLTPEDQRYLKGYLDRYIQRYVRSSQNQIRKTLTTAVEINLSPEIALDRRLEEWEQKRPDKEAVSETVRATNVIAREIYRAAGIAALIWVAVGADTCPICLDLDGRRFPMTGRHPPIHMGCQCQLMAG